MFIKCWESTSHNPRRVITDRLSKKKNILEKKKKSATEFQSVTLQGQDFILRVYVRTKARFCARTKVCRNLRKNPFINPSQGKIMRVHLHPDSSQKSPHMELTMPSFIMHNLICIHLHAYSHPRDTLFNTVKGTRR